MHRNRRYVKLAWIGLLPALSLPSLARTEVVAPTRGPALPFVYAGVLADTGGPFSELDGRLVG
jgi:hypothetical protein